MLIQDILSPDDAKFSATFVFRVEELGMIDDALSLLLKVKSNTRKVKAITQLKEGVSYARHSLQGVIDGVIRENGEI